MSDVSTFVILLGGDLYVDDRVLNMVEHAHVIAADGGIDHAEKLGVEPLLWVGDFDSSSDEHLKQYQHLEQITFDRSKDQTDGSLSIKLALERGARKIILLGAMGGDRTDHTLGVLFEMAALKDRNIEVFATNGKEDCWPLHNSQLNVELPKGSLFSVLPLSDLSGLSIKGAQYPLDNVEVNFGSSFTMSNVSLGSTVVNVKSGRCLVIARPHDFSGI